MRFNNRLFKYLFGGGITFGTEYITFYFLYVVLLWPLFVANSVSFGIGIMTSFTINRYWAFKSDTHKRAGSHQFIIYCCLALINLGIVNLALGGLQYLGLDPRIGKIVVMLAVPAWNYFIFKKYIFVNE